VVLLAACSIGAPPGFSEGDTWSFPLVDPLADGRLVTPVTIDGKGPFLFAIDPNTRDAIVDMELYKLLGAQGAEGMIGDQADKTHHAYDFTLPNVQIGDLRVSLLYAVAWNNHRFDSAGRRIYGVIGREVLADSLVFGFDRDRGIAWVKTTQAFSPPADARVLDYSKGDRTIGYKGRSNLYLRHELVSAAIDGRTYPLAIDFGRVVNQLRYGHWAETGIAPVTKASYIVDEVGGWRATEFVGNAHHVETQGIARDALGFVTFDDQRILDDGEIEGSLGLDFWKPFAVADDQQHEKLYLTPRRDPAESAQLRMNRWGAMLPCGATGCAAVQITSDAAPRLQVTRDPSAGQAPLELVVAATAANGDKLPMLTISLPAGVADLSTPLDPRYTGATVDVIDASPFPRDCDSPAHCVIAQDRQ
jgi:hypothetical protein